MFNYTKSLKGRLAIYFALAITASLLLSGFLTFGLMQRYLRMRLVSDLKSQAESLSHQIETEGLPQKRYIVDLERMYGTRALIVPHNDQAINQLPGEPGSAGLSQQLSQLMNWNAISNGQTQVERVQLKLPGFYSEQIVAIHGFNAGGQLAGAVVLAKPVNQLQPWRPIAGWLLISAVSSLVISMLLAFMLARRLSRPLHEITQAATAVAAGDFSSEIDVQSEDEIGRLADAFRFMSDEVQKSQEQQRQFVISVSHELKTPLTAIAGHTQALREGVAEDPQAVAESLKVIEAETRRLHRLIEDLLSIAKADARQFELKRSSIHVGDIAADTISRFSREAKQRRVQLSSTGESGLVISTDPDRLRQIVSNLVNNALAHTPAGGKITISMRRFAGNAEVEVADDGPGIDPADLPHIFDRFYRSVNVRNGPGLGLGLSISRELAHALGGDITASSNPGQGSRFVVKLPL